MDAPANPPDVELGSARPRSFSKMSVAGERLDLELDPDRLEVLLESLGLGARRSSLSLV